MRLIELDPQWLVKDGARVGFTFRSPINQKWRQSCFVQPMKISDQMELFESVHGEEGVQPCKKSFAWSVEGGIANADFGTISVTPSLNGSDGGLWHGFITKGEIVGGV